MDLVNLTLSSIGMIARRVLAATHEQDRCRRFRKRQIEDILLRAIYNQRLQLDDLNDHLRLHMTRVLTSRGSQQERV